MSAENTPLLDINNTDEVKRTVPLTLPEAAAINGGIGLSGASATGIAAHATAETALLNLGKGIVETSAAGAVKGAALGAFGGVPGSLLLGICYYASGAKSAAQCVAGTVTSSITTPVFGAIAYAALDAVSVNPYIKAGVMFGATLAGTWAGFHGGAKIAEKVENKTCCVPTSTDSVISAKVV